MNGTCSCQEAKLNGKLGSMRIRSLCHSTYQHCYHIVWGTKYRRKFFKKYVEQEFKESLYKEIKKHPTLHVFAVQTDKDHVHLQIEIAPDMAVSSVVQRLKIVTSKALKKEFAFIRRIYIDGSIWSVGYFSSTNGLNEEQVKKYIEAQGKEEMPKQASFEFL